MKPTQVEVSWDQQKSQWLVRIQAGEEVLRRHCDLPKDAEESALRRAALGTTRDEGYDVADLPIVVQR